MAHSAKVLADSITLQGHRLVTLEVTFPRIILAEINTHRMFSRCSASSRAIPIEKMIQRVIDDPYIPGEWGENRPGMSAGAKLGEAASKAAIGEWLDDRDCAISTVKNLQDLNVHKQWANRLLEPFLWHTAIISTTELNNFYAQRIDAAAHPDMFITAACMKTAIDASTPRLADNPAEWHLPYVLDEEIRQSDHESYSQCMRHVRKWSVARCARVSYMNHNGTRDTVQDEKRHDSLLEMGHMSPFEHVARPMYPVELESTTFICRDDDIIEVKGFCGNFRGWVQYRKEIPNEENFLGHKKGLV